MLSTAAQLKKNFQYLFIPHKDNNHRAKLLHAPSILLVTAALLIFNELTSVVNTKYKILGYAANISPQKVISLTNEKRQSEGLVPLTENSILDKAAYDKGLHMLEHDYWAHVAPDGTEPWYFFAHEGYSYRFAGENLARDFTNPQSAVDAWMASPTHRENMLSAKYTEIGVAVVEGDLNGEDTTIIVQFFGTTSVDTAPALPLASADQDNNIGGGNSLVSEVNAQVQEFEATQPVQYQEQIAGVVDHSDKVSPFWLSKNTSLILISVFLAVFLIDSLIVAYRGIARMGGRQFAHISFLGMTLIILVISQSGKIF